MKTQTDKFPFLLSAIAAIAVVLLGIAALARIVGWQPNSIGGFGNIFAIEMLSAASANSVAEPEDKEAPQASGNARGKSRCPECGVIVSMREFDASFATASLDGIGQKLAGNDKDR